jgi:hypothetical protein
MNLTEISFANIKKQIETYLKNTYSKSNVLFTNASPYGQILSVLENLFQLSILYLKNSIKQFDILNPTSTNQRVIKNAAIFAGHIPGRSISATGTLKFTIKTSSNPESDIPGGRITFKNRQSIKNKTNGLEYSLNLGSDSLSFHVDTRSQFFISIIQGKWESVVFTGTGNENQTYQVSVRGLKKDVENFNYEVLVNGQLWEIKKHLYDLLPDENSCVVRTGFEGGVDIIFGNGGFGAMPPISSSIEVKYLTSDGANGSIFRRTLNDWTFVDEPIDGFGNSIDVSNIFDVSIYNDINFGADKESIDFTKNVLPIVSNNFVLGLPQQYAYQLKKLGVFSHVNAYEAYGTIFIVATPNIKLFKNRNSSYFDISLSAFSLDEYEISKIDNYLKSGGNIQLSRRYKIVSPVLSYYIINIFIVTYSDSKDESVDSQIYNIVSNYFLNLSRFNRIPKSDIVSLLSTINDIYSVDISFLSRKNEEYHRDAILKDINRKNSYAPQSNLKSGWLQPPNPNYNPNITLGLDPVVGDILFENNEVPIIRGGWRDRNNFYYSDNIKDMGLKSVMIIRKGVVDSSKRQKV